MKGAILHWPENRLEWLILIMVILLASALIVFAYLRKGS